MIIFLYGKDTYRLQQKLKEIESRYKKLHKAGLNLEKLDARNTSFEEFWEVLFQRSMFVKKKLFFLENVFSNEKFKKDFLQRIEEVAESQDVVVLVEKKEGPLKSDSFFRKLNQLAKDQEFKPLTGQKLKSWVVKEFKKYEAEAETEALEKLTGFVGSDLWQMSNEIKKLVSYTKSVRKEDVDLLVRAKIEAEIFKTIDALAQRNKKKALELIQKHLDKGDSPFYILKMVNFQVRNLLLVKSSQPEREFGYYSNASVLAKKLGMHPFVFKKTMSQAGRFSLEELKKIYRRIFETDLDIKTGKIMPEEGLRMLIAAI